MSLFKKKPPKQPVPNLDLAATLIEGASRRWEALLKFDHGEERRELAQAGVPSHRIEALYPYSFIALIPSIIDLLAAQKVQPHQGTASTLPPTTSIWNKLDRAQQSQLYADVQEVSADPAWASLRGAVYDSLPFSGGRLSYANSAIDRLHELCWYMNRDPQLRHELHSSFILIIDILLPNLLTQNDSPLVATASEIR